MKIQLHQYLLPIPLQRVPEVLADPSQQATETMNAEIDVTECFAVVDRLRDSADAGERTRPGFWDAELAPVLHEALSPVLTRRQAADPRMWMWLSTATHLKEFVWLRWHGLVSSDPVTALSGSDAARRFHAANSLVGLARNGLARLYWTVETLADGADPQEAEELTSQVLQNADLHLNIFERRLGLHPATARAAVRTLANLGEDGHRRALRRLNQLATTTVLERMSEAEVAELLRS